MLQKTGSTATLTATISQTADEDVAISQYGGTGTSANGTDYSLVYQVQLLFLQEYNWNYYA